MLAYFLFLAGLIALAAGAYLLVQGASRIATVMGAPAVVIGLTVVAVGTSTPELLTSAVASWEEQPETALGNVIGSNIANIGLILGLTVVIAPIVPDRTVLRREGPVLIGASLLIVVLGFTGTIEPWMGGLLLVALAAFVVLALQWSRDEPGVVVEQVLHFQKESGIGRPAPLWQAIAFTAAGIVLLATGGPALVTGAVDIADDLGISEFVVAATIVAIGTSLPELATSITAALRREADIAIGNVIGSNIFNLLGVLGAAALINPIPLTSDMQWLDLPWMAGLAVVGVALARQGFALTRVEGAALLFAYVVYVGWIVIR